MLESLHYTGMEFPSHVLFNNIIHCICCGLKKDFLKLRHVAFPKSITTRKGMKPRRWEKGFPVPLGLFPLLAY